MSVVIDVIQVWDTSGQSNKQTGLQWPVLFYSKLFLPSVYVSSNFILSDHLNDSRTNCSRSIVVIITC